MHQVVQCGYSTNLYLIRMSLHTFSNRSRIKRYSFPLIDRKGPGLGCESAGIWGVEQGPLRRFAVDLERFSLQKRV